MKNLETIILNNLITNEEYYKKTIAFFKEEYFHDRVERYIFKLINDYISKYNRRPSKSALYVDMTNTSGLTEEEYKKAKIIIDEFSEECLNDFDWLVDSSESFCKQKALYNAIRESIKLIDDKNGNNIVGSIPKLLEDALSVSFDVNIGHDFLSNWEERYEYYHIKEHKIPFDLEYLNKITDGGVSKKTLTCLMAGVGVGKSLTMCHMAASNLSYGKNVLYITMEMAEEKIAERIDANLLDVTIKELKNLSKNEYEKKIERLKEKTKGKLIIKEYPTSGAGSGHFRHLLNELKIKKEFIPDIIYIDYLNICSSSRLKNGNVNSYTYIKSIAEELRGLAVEFALPIITATQVTRSGYGSSDVEMTDVSESFGLPATVDLMLALISTEELYSLGQLMFKQIKNRYNDPGYMRRFVVGVDRNKMRLFDVEDSANDNLVDDTPVMDNSNFGKRDLNDTKFDKRKFDNFK